MNFNEELLFYLATLLLINQQSNLIPIEQLWVYYTISQIIMYILFYFAVVLPFVYDSTLQTYGYIKVLYMQ